MNTACVQKSLNSGSEHMLVAVQNSLQSPWISNITVKKKKAEIKNLWYVLWWDVSWDTDDKITFCTLVVKNRKFYHIFTLLFFKHWTLGTKNFTIFADHVNHVFHFTSHWFFTQSLRQIFVNSEYFFSNLSKKLHWNSPVCRTAIYASICSYNKT